MIRLYTDGGTVIDVNGDHDNEPTYTRIHSIEIRDDGCTVVLTSDSMNQENY